VAPVAAEPAEAPAAAAPAAPATAAEPAVAKSARKPRSPRITAPAPEPVAEPAAEPVIAAAAEPMAVGDLLTDQAMAVLQAIHTGMAVELVFQDPDSNPPRTFEPRQLTFDALAKAWFVWGWDRRYNAERHHRLDLVAQVTPVEGVGRAAQGPYKDGTPANLIGGWLGGEPIHVKAVLLKQWIFAVRQAPSPFPEFKLEEIEEGKAQVTFVGTDLRAIARWAMQFGDGIQVIEPQRLQDRIKQVGITWGGKPATAERPAAPPAPAPRPPRAEHGHRPEHRAEHRAEPREAREHRETREPREVRESAPRHRPEPSRNLPEAPKPTTNKAGKIEIRIDRL